jgi:hypothetical protein
LYYCLWVFFNSFVTVPVAQWLSAWQSVWYLTLTVFLYFDFCILMFFSRSPSGGIVTSINEQILSFVFLIIMSCLPACRSLCTRWYHTAVISPYSHESTSFQFLRLNDSNASFYHTCVNQIRKYTTSDDAFTELKRVLKHKVNKESVIVVKLFSYAPYVCKT